MRNWQITKRIYKKNNAFLYRPVHTDAKTLIVKRAATKAGSVCAVVLDCLER